MATVDARRQQALSLQSGVARAAVLGVNDGLLTNASLILGVVGAAATGTVVQLAGLASLVAGACSMALGEYVSMRAQVEMLERLVLEEREAMRAAPGQTSQLLRETLIRHGFAADTAAEATRDLERDPEQALGVYVRAVLGINPDELGSPWAAAAWSFLSFALGALVPLLPWLFTDGSRAAVLSLLLAAVGALAVGGLLGRLTDGRIVHAAVRQLLVVALGCAVTYLVGNLFGVFVS
jgi:VIT1/CCC1 family predicted Fe2+/Mn2+ transporter